MAVINYTDTLDQYPYYTQTHAFDENYVADWTSTVWDNGVRSLYDVDQKNTEIWSSMTSYYNPATGVYTGTFVMDDGTTLSF